MTISRKAIAIWLAAVCLVDGLQFRKFDAPLIAHTVGVSLRFSQVAIRCGPVHSTYLGAVSYVPPTRDFDFDVDVQNCRDNLFIGLVGWHCDK